MSKLFPELVFIRGPQKGQRVALSKTMNVIGREKGCDVELQDEYASRQHARLIVEGTRVRLVNTSPNGTRVNGKPAEQAVLNDGDVIGFGLECDMQFESTESAAQAKPKSAGPTPLPAGAKRGESAAVPAEAAAPGEPGEQPAKAKLKKPPAILWVGIYMLVIAALFIFLPTILGGDKNKPVAEGQPLTVKQIAELIKKPVVREENKRLAGEALSKAVRGVEAWENYTTPPDHLYRTYYLFKLALAYSGPDVKDFGTEVYRLPNSKPRPYQEMMDKVERQLVENVNTAYQNAHVEQRQGHWQQAKMLYRSVLEMIGEQEQLKTFGFQNQQDPIYLNVLKQLNIVNSEMLREKERTGPKNW